MFSCLQCEERVGAVCAFVRRDATHEAAECCVCGGGGVSNGEGQEEKGLNHRQATPGAPAVKSEPQLPPFRSSKQGQSNASCILRSASEAAASVAGLSSATAAAAAAAMKQQRWAQRRRRVPRGWRVQGDCTRQGEGKGEGRRSGPRAHHPACMRHHHFSTDERTYLIARPRFRATPAACNAVRSLLTPVAVVSATA